MMSRVLICLDLSQRRACGAAGKGGGEGTQELDDVPVADAGERRHLAHEVAAGGVPGHAHALDGGLRPAEGGQVGGAEAPLAQHLRLLHLQS